MDNAAQFESMQQQKFKQPRQLDASTMQLIAEAQAVDPSLVEVHRVLMDEIERKSGKGEPDYIEVDIPRKIKISKKIMVPLMRNPEFNYIGKLMGPGGSTLKKLQEKVGCRIYVSGRGSSKDPSSEQQLLESGDPKHRHFAENLHVRVDILATPIEGYRKLADVLEEIKAHFSTDLEDEISKSQIAELGFNPSDSAVKTKVALAASATGRGTYRGNFRARGATASFARGGGRAPYAPRGFGRGSYPAAGRTAAGGDASGYAPTYPGAQSQMATPNSESFGYAGGDFRPPIATAAAAGMFGTPRFPGRGAGGVASAVRPTGMNGATAAAGYSPVGGGKFLPASGAARGAYRTHPYVVGPAGHNAPR